jgi:UDP-N-acetyl-D-mannosaminuronate dehydrogenase
MANSIDETLAESDAIILLVKHTQFKNFRPEEIAAKTKARIIIDCVNAWDRNEWQKAGFELYRLGVNKPETAN